MSKPVTNTKKIKTLVVKIPNLFEAWSDAIKNQNDNRISKAWISTVKHFFPDTEGLDPESVLKLIKKKKLPYKNPSDFHHSIKIIADILVDLSDELCFGKKERLLDYCGLEPEGIINPGYYQIDVTKKLNGFSYSLSEVDTKVHSWFSSKKLPEAELVKIVQDYEQDSIQSYASWTLAFSTKEIKDSEKIIYNLYVSDDEMFYYVEEPEGPDGIYQADPQNAFNCSSLKINKSSSWKITEGQWDKNKILYYFKWQDLNIKWFTSDEDEVVVYDPLNLSEEEEKERASFIAEVKKQCRVRAKELGLPREESQELAKDVRLEMVLIPAGKFVMGSPASEVGHNDNETQHGVKITKPYYMGKYAVTQEQWEAVTGDIPSDTKGAMLPVTNVSWEDCQQFIKKLNAKTDGDYRLPKEAEWEYACRAGTSIAYSFGVKITPKDANYDDSAINKPIDVRSYKPNTFGIYNMHGNVCEWCENWHGEYLAGADTDPKWPATGEYRVLRGGSFGLNKSTARSSNRGGSLPTFRYGDVGFRLAKDK